MVLGEVLPFTMEVTDHSPSELQDIPEGTGRLYMKVYLEGVGLWWRMSVRLDRRGFIEMGVPVTQDFTS